MTKEANTNAWTNPRSWGESLIKAIVAVAAQNLTERKLGNWSWGVFGVAIAATDMFFDSFRKKEEELQTENTQLKVELKKTSKPLPTIEQYRTDHTERLKSEEKKPSTSLHL